MIAVDLVGALLAFLAAAGVSVALGSAWLRAHKASRHRKCLARIDALERELGVGPYHPLVGVAAPRQQPVTSTKTTPTPRCNLCASPMGSQDDLSALNICRHCAQQLAVRKTPPPAQPAQVTVRVQRDENGEAMIPEPCAYTKGRYAGKKWIRVPFVVTGGTYDSYRAALFLTLDIDNPLFGQTFQTVTGANPVTIKSSGAPDFLAQLAEGTFEAVIRQQMTWDAAAQMRVPSQHTEIVCLTRRVDSSAPALPDPASETGSGESAIERAAARARGRRKRLVSTP